MSAITATLTSDRTAPGLTDGGLALDVHAADPIDRRRVALIAEDETLVRLIANDMLTDAGFRVLEACDGQEALTVLAANCSICVLFTDVSMPHLDGLELANLAKRRWPKLAVVVTSGRTNPPKGAVFVAKPYTSETLLTGIETALAAAERGLATT